jgi:hypothetical protein
VINPTDDQALQFALILQAGLPATQAIQYFTESSDPLELGQLAAKWLRSKVVKQAQTRLMGRAWAEMSLDERINKALDQHYAGMAWLLFSTHYVDASSSDKGKLDSARQALEARRAGTAGKGDALSRFFDDLNTGRLKLASSSVSLLKQ